ncbi:MAG: Gfo/Idh/MocA family oxidoreductase [Planctomycetota bacterium]
MAEHRKPARGRMNEHRVGIIGYGWVAGAHITAINQTRQARVAAIWSSRPQDAGALSQKHGCELTCYTELEQMLRDPVIDVVAICSYPQQHAEHAIAAARAGKHVIIEKPLALAWADCKRIARAVQDAGVKTCVCFECRFSSQFLATRAIIDQGLLGKVHYGEVDYYHGIGPWYGQFRWNTRRDAGGSSLLSAGCHAMDALLLCMDGELSSVSSAATASKNRIFRQYEYPTTSVTILRFADGRIGKVASVIDCWQPYYFHTHLVGSEGSLLDNKFHSTLISGLNKHQWSTLTMKLLDSGDVSDHPYSTQFQAFFDSLDAGKEMPLTSLAEALRTHQAIFAADLSARSGKPVKIRA